jgi:probable F420-dependent oxidoreductase
MRIGVVFPQTEFGSDPSALRDYANTIEELGYSHLLAYDHVLGANPDRPGGWSGPYTHNHSFLEPFLLFSFVAAITNRLEFVTGILILPQRQTALVAKQAATLDVISSGRFRLGVGVGWNEVEYIALNQKFRSRGKRIEEQVELLRRLWAQPLVTYQGRWHQIPDAGLNPLPNKSAIPIWYGGHADPVLRRIADSGNGWLPNYKQAADAKRALEKLDLYLTQAGRSREEIGLEPRLHYGNGDPDCWADTIRGWQAVGATHLSVNTMGCGFENPVEHIGALRRFAETMGL